MGSSKHIEQQADVVIIGGGMVGLSLACLLAKVTLGLRIVVLDAQPFAAQGAVHAQPSFDGRSTAIAPGSMHILQQLGLWDALASKAEPIQKVQVSDRGHWGHCDYASSDNHGEALGYVVENTWLGTHLVQLAQRFSSIEILAPAEVTGLEAAPGGQRVHIQREQTSVIEASLVVLADGASSPLAKRIGIRFDQHDYAQRAIVANIQHEQPHQGCAFERFTEDGPLALLPLGDFDGGHRSALVWTQVPEVGERRKALPEKVFIAELHRVFGYSLGPFLRIGARSDYSLSLNFAREQVRTGLVLMGNAAHFLHPVAGQGFNLALRDCASLVAQLRLAQHRNQPLGALDTLLAYINQRETDQWLTAELSHSFIQWFVSANPLKRVVRHSALATLNTISPLKTLFFEQMMGRAGKGVVLR